jgi:hypothetical protein
VRAALMCRKIDITYGQTNRLDFHCSKYDRSSTATRAAHSINGGEFLKKAVCSSPLSSHFSLHYLPVPSPMTTYVLYSPDGAIDKFFNSNTTVTRQQCDEFAISRAGGVSSALQMQGVCSYTVTAGPKLFQFRDENLPLIWAT